MGKGLVFGDRWEGAVPITDKFYARHRKPVEEAISQACQGRDIRRFCRLQQQYYNTGVIRINVSSSRKDNIARGRVLYAAVAPSIMLL